MNRRDRTRELLRRIGRVPFLPRPLGIVVLALLALVLLPYVIAPFYNFGRPVSTLMLWRWATGARVERNYVPIERISPQLTLAVIIAEDGRFCGHPGVDVTEIREVLADAETFEEMRGGSTITQQVAKNLFLWPGRSYLRKALEIPLALWLDLVMPKSRVLEIYLNIAEWGPTGEFGAEAGSRRAFNRSADRLSRYQAALLAAALPNPHRRDARRPGRGHQRLARLYMSRAARSPHANDCVRRTP